MNYKISVTVNGRAYEREVEPRLLLSDFLRHDLALTGTHVGCEHGVCGACTILFDGEPVRSCILLAVFTVAPMAVKLMDSRVPISPRTTTPKLALTPTSIGLRPALIRFAFQSSTSSMMLTAACSASVASPPVGLGTPKSAISASPEKFSMEPRCAKITFAIRR